VTDVNGAPFISPLFKEEAKATVAFSVDFATIKFKSLRDGGFHFSYCAIALNIGRASVDTMHNEGASIHSTL
jgi:hypothetical protein